MNKFLRVSILLGIIFGLGISCASAENISFVPNTVNLSLGSSQQVQVVMDSVPKGLAGFNITFNISDPGIANITGVSSPSWANVSLSRNSTLPSSSVWVKAIDLDGAKPNHTVVPGATNVVLGNITITGLKGGNTTIIIQPSLISADGGNSIIPNVTLGKINVITIFPGSTFSPTINDTDGLCEDVNGNGRLDYGDLLTYFKYINWIPDNEPIALFDYNKNGRIDYGDLYLLYNMMHP
jgi:PKD repeat protein